MNKMTTAALAGLVAISSAAQASMSRWNGFGIAQAFIADVQDIWTLPAVAASNTDATYFEFGAAPGGLGGATVNDSNGATGIVANTGVAWGGVHMSLGPGVLGIWANRPYGEFSNLGNISGAFLAPALGNAARNPTAAVAVPGATAVRNYLDVLYGFNVGENLILGIGLTTAGNVGGGAFVNKTENTLSTGAKATTENNAGGLGVNLGADVKNLGPIALLEIGLQYVTRSDMTSNKVEAGVATDGTNKNTQTGSDINLRIGADVTGDGGAFQRFEVLYSTENLEAKTESDGLVTTNLYTSLKRSASMWGLGWAMGKSNDKGLGLGGFILWGQSQENSAPFAGLNLNTNTAANPVAGGPALTAAGTENNKNTMGQTNLTFVSAGETKVKDWLSARAGLSTNLFSSTATTYEVGAAGAVNKVSTSNSSTNGGATLSTGLGLNFGAITVDGTLNQDFLFSGPFFTNGIAERLFGQVSATWGWGGSKE